MTFRLPFLSPALIIAKEVCHTAELYCGIAYPWILIRQSLSLDVFKSNLKNDDFDGIFHVRNFYFAFIHGFLVKQFFIICLIIVVVVNDLLAR